jgi:hypothetical protein
VSAGVDESQISDYSNSTYSGTGIADLSSFVIRRSGVYYVKGSGGSVSSSCSPSITVTAADLDSVVFQSVVPSSPVTAGILFSPQPVVLARDVYGNPIAGIQVTLSAFLTSCTGTAYGGLMPNNIAVTSDTGLATFSGINLDLAASDVFIKASTAAGKIGCTSSGITVVPGSASSLTWSIPITTGQVTAGRNFSSQPVLVLRDPFGNAIKNETITLSLYSDHTCSTLALDPAKQVNGSIATTNTTGAAVFSGFSTAVAGTYYVKASMRGISSSCSGAGGALTVTSDAPQSFLFEEQPEGTVQAGLAFPTQAVIKVLDQYSNPVSGVVVTLQPLEFSADCSAGTALNGTLGGRIVSTGLNGLATFTTTYFDRAVSAMKLRATAGGGKSDLSI